jgi:prolyl 4-hydroxylase
MNVADLRHYIRWYDADLAPEFCERMIGSFHAMQRFQLSNGRGHRAGLEDSGWTELNISKVADAAFLGFFRQAIDRALERYNADVGLTLAVPNSPTHADLVMKRYRPGGAERFQLHFDSIYELSNRYLVLLWYLNDVAEGGETAFPQLDVAVAPRAGRLIVFPPFWMWQHEGRTPVSGDKYIVSTYLTF